MSSGPVAKGVELKGDGRGGKEAGEGEGVERGREWRVGGSGEGEGGRRGEGWVRKWGTWKGEVEEEIGKCVME